MDTTSNRERLIAACDTTADAAPAVLRAQLRARLAGGSRPGTAVGARPEH